MLDDITNTVAPKKKQSGSANVMKRLMTMRKLKETEGFHNSAFTLHVEDVEDDDTSAFLQPEILPQSEAKNHLLQTEIKGMHHSNRSLANLQEDKASKSNQRSERKLMSNAGGRNNVVSLNASFFMSRRN